MTANEVCQAHGHAFTYRGLVYSQGDRLAGSSAFDTVYEDAFFCSRCLLRRYDNTRVIGNSYTAPLKGSAPK